MHPTLKEAKVHYEKLIKMHDHNHHWKIHGDGDSLIIEFSPASQVRGFVARLVHVGHPKVSGDGYFILFLWDAFYSGALGVIEKNHLSTIEPSYFAKHLMEYADHLSHYEDSDSKDPFRYLLSKFGGMFCRSNQDLQSRIFCKYDA